MHKKYVVTKALLVNPFGKILLLRGVERNPEPNKPQYWDLPGGRLEDDETLFEGLAREIREEIGFEMDTRQARLFHTDIWNAHGADILNEPVIGLFYVALVSDISVRLSHEHDAFEWIDPRLPLPELMSEQKKQAIKLYCEQEGLVSQASDEIKGHQGFGLVQVMTGNGKGKTTSALGQILRAVGVGKKVGVIFFDKGGSHYSERNILQSLGVAVVGTGRDRIDSKTGRFDFSLCEEDKIHAAQGMEAARKMFQEGFDVVVLDEIHSSIHLGMIDLKELLELMDQKPPAIELILTGRNASQKVIERAHLVTEMQLKKHYFYSGVKAREGLDY